VAGVAGLVFVVMWLSSRIINVGMGNIRSAGVELSDQMYAAVPSSEANEEMAEDTDESNDNSTDVESVAENTEVSSDEEPVDAVGEAASEEESTDVLQDAVITPQNSAIDEAVLNFIRECRLSSDDASVVVSEALRVLREALHSRQEQHVRLEQAISAEEERVAWADSMRGVIAGFVEQMTVHERKMELCDLADELLTGSASHMSQRFNRDLRDLVSRTLPLFTENRYEHLQIDEDLNVRVFSNEKRDFMGLDEISSGTQRQIMLAVRLALSQELVNIAVQGEQFIFLDEPFAFFDQERTRNSMAVLPKLSDEIKQVWVIAQEFPPGTEFDRAIECSREYDSLPQATN